MRILNHIVDNCETWQLVIIGAVGVGIGLIWTAQYSEPLSTNAHMKRTLRINRMLSFGRVWERGA